MGHLKIVKLHFRSALHLGADISGIGLEDSQLVAHSDTLFSCLINNYADLHSGSPKAVEKLLEPFRDGDPPFRISSAFPFQMPPGYGVTYYLPKPLVDPPLFYSTEVGREAKQDYGKLVRNTQLIRIDTFQKWQRGEEAELDDLKDTAEEIGDFYRREIRPQHARDRLTDAATIYHTGLVHLHRSAGLYFLIELNNKTLLDWNTFEVVLRQAGRSGLGGRRSHGNGTFEVASDAISDLDDSWQELFREKEDFNGFINLSLCLPENFDCLKPVAYQLVPRRGWCYSSIAPAQLKRKTVTMFSEGSVFRNETKGALAEVTPDKFKVHKVYRYGISLSLPINILEEKNDVS